MEYDVVRTPAGELRGEFSGAVAIHRGIEFAQAERFAMAELDLSFTGDCTHDGPSSWQNPSAFDIVVGPTGKELYYGENCLNLKVTRPARTQPGSNLPVMLWIHGGAYVAGSSSMHGYDPSEMVEQNDVVVVSINYRLGALGFLAIDGVAPHNLGLWDMVRALEWVQAQISYFGGDPGNVTLFGQSAGADAIAYLLGMPAAADLFHKAIVQSAPLGLRTRREEISTAIQHRFLQALGGEDPRKVPAQEILRAQEIGATAANNYGRSAGMPCAPVPGHHGLPYGEAYTRELIKSAQSKALLIGYTRNDMLPFILGAPNFELWRQNSLMQHLIRPVALALGPGLNELVFAHDAKKLADLFAKQGAPTYSYRFDWYAPESEYLACHGIELPFLLGHKHVWEHAPMLLGADWEDLMVKGQVFKACWANFARSGNPTPAGTGSATGRGPVWKAHKPSWGPSRTWPPSAPEHKTMI